MVLWKWVKAGDGNVHVPYADGVKTDNSINTEGKQRRELRFINHRFPVQG